MKLEKIRIYPVKSLRGIDLQHSTVTRRGLRDDRRYMLVDKDLRLVTQRELPLLAKLAAKADVDSIELTKEGAGTIGWRPDPVSEKRAQVTVWNSTVDAIVADDSINEQIRALTGMTLFLVYMPDDSLREINPIFNRGNEIVSFADGYPLLLTTKASLEDLNKRLESPVPMERFRPNIVVDGCNAFDEDGWSRIQVGETVFRVTKPCARCKVTTIDQLKGRVTGVEPLKTLAGFRRSSVVFPLNFSELGLGQNDVLFGTNLVPENPGGIIRIDDEVVLMD